MTDLSDAEPVGLGRKSAVGIAWTVGGLALGEPVRVIITAVLARLLTPQDFGVLGMAAVVTGLVAVANDFGLQTAIVQRERVSKDELDSVFWFNLLLGGLLTAVGVVVAAPVAAFFRQPAVTPVLAALSFSFVISSLGQIQHAILRREMDFKTPAAATLAGVLVAGAGAVVMALRGAGVWALVVNVLVAVGVSAAVVEVKTRFVPTLRLRWSEARSYVTFGGVLTVAEFANYGGGNVDNLVVGRVLGASSLGVYALAFNLVTYPVRRIAATIAGVTMPAFSRIQRERARYERAFLAAIEMSSVVVFPLLAAAAVAGEDIVLGLYGPKWTAAVMPFRLLCAAGLARSVGVFAETGFKSTGRPKSYLAWSIASVLGVLIGASAGLHGGVNGVAMGVAGATVIVSLASVTHCARVLEASTSRLWLGIARAGLVGALSAAVSLACVVVLADTIVPRLVTGVIAVLLGMAGAWGVFRWSRHFASLRAVEGVVAGLARRKPRSE